MDEAPTPGIPLTFPWDGASPYTMVEVGDQEVKVTNPR